MACGGSEQTKEDVMEAWSIIDKMSVGRSGGKKNQ
jgi:hypothetical protein